MPGLMNRNALGVAAGCGPALFELCHALANADSMQGMFDAVVTALVAVTGCERAAALAFDGAGVMRFRAERGLSVRYQQAVEGHSPWTADSRGAEAILVDDVLAADQLAALQPVLAAENIRALAFLPLQAGGRLLGKFMLYADRPLDWRTVDLRFAAAAGDLLASFLLREEAQERLLRARKMESLGLLAGGIAHDFNNLLTAVLGHVDLLRAETLRGTPARGHVDQLLAVAERAAELTRQLLGFARPQAVEREIVDVGAFLAEAEPSLGRCCAPSHQLQIDLAPALPGVLTDRALLQQVLLLLLQNAKAAMQDGGTIRVRASAGSSPDVVELAVIDRGVGMDEAVRRRLFEPMFSTSLDGRDTGLGLATCYAIVRGLGGDIAVRSAPGAGSTFLIGLPVASAAAAPAPVAAEVPVMATTVLLVDDQEVVARALQSSLLRGGFRVLLAGDGRQALAVLQHEAVDAVVTDAVMPGMGGVELVQRLRQLRPELPVLLISGFVDEPLDLPRGIPLLHKPFLPRELVHRLRQMLPEDAARPAGKTAQTLSGS
jgi:signal transduction histidine kinase